MGMQPDSRISRGQELGKLPHHVEGVEAERWLTIFHNQLLAQPGMPLAGSDVILDDWDRLCRGQVDAAPMASAHRIGKRSVQVPHVPAVKRDTRPAVQAPIMQHALVSHAHGVERHAPTFPEIWLFLQALRTKLETKSLALAVIHLQCLNPLQMP